MNVYSEDFRKKVVEYIEAGHSKAETKRTFSVCRESINRWLKLKLKNPSGITVHCEYITHLRKTTITRN